jgi:hypothetical protein
MGAPLVTGAQSNCKPAPPALIDAAAAMLGDSAGDVQCAPFDDPALPGGAAPPGGEHADVDATAGLHVRIPLALLARDDLTPADKLVLAYLQYRMNGSGKTWPGQRRIAAATGLSAAGVNKCVERLAGPAVALLTVTRAGSNAAGRTNEYQCSQSGRPRSERPQGERGRPLCERGRPLREQRKNKRREQEKRSSAPAAPDLWQLARAAMTADTLRTPTFEAAYREWIDDRRERGKRLTSGAVKKQIKQLESYGHDTAIKCIERSIERGWTGLFPPDDDRGGGAGRAGGRANPARLAAPAGKYAHVARRGAPDAAAAAVPGPQAPAPAGST